jgi:hypothetical protein
LETILGPLEEVRDQRVFNYRDLRQKTILDGHRRIFEQMTPALATIIGIIERDGPGYQSNPNIRAPYNAIMQGFEDLKRFNKENGLSATTGCFDVERWAGLYLAYTQLAGNPRQQQANIMRDFCEHHGLPNWYPDIEAGTGHGPQSKEQQQPEWAHDSLESRVEIWGNKAIIRVPARTPLVYSYEKGYTPSGEKIIARQEYGSVMKLVLWSADGYRLASSASVGGKLAQKSARDANVPLVLGCDAATSYLDQRLAACKTGFDFCVPYVAIGEKVLGSERTPNTVCAVMTILDNNADTKETQWMPRSALKKFEGDRQLDSQLGNLVVPREDKLLNEALVHGYRRAGAKEEDLRHLIRNDGEDEKLARRLQALRLKDPLRLEKIISAVALPRLEWKRA